MSDRTDIHADDRLRTIEAGFRGDATVARDSLLHADAAVRASALVALDRIGSLTDDDVRTALADSDPRVRRTALELSPAHPAVEVHALVDDTDLFVAEMAAWAVGERTEPGDAAVMLLVDRTTSHPEQLVREACAAALGSIGDPRGLPAILSACNDKPAVRRRAVLALAPFEGPEVDAALQHALQDRDWQVRQNAEILLNPR